MLLLHPVGDGPLAAGFLLSALWGYRLEADYVRFNVKGHWWQNVIKASLGIAVLFALHSGLKPIFSVCLPILEATPLLHRHFLPLLYLGWWVALLAPLCFKALRLYRRDGYARLCRTALPLHIFEAGGGQMRRERPVLFLVFTVL